MADDELLNRVVSSALWAAAGDALGWTTELGREGTVEARTGLRHIDRPVNWVRRIGGRGGAHVPLAAGTYSDDTQLRLAVCRSIRGDGVFDAEAFARIELTTWQGYALGAGLGSKAAAANLSKRGVNWFSNFFETRDQRYSNAGGNGAAMRVQPHAWLKADRDELIVSTLRDALITHGHPHGFAGAVLHAVSVSHALTGKLPGPSDFDDLFEAVTRIPVAVDRDRQLSAFWKPAWENQARRSLDEACSATLNELRADARAIQDELKLDNADAYPAVLHKLELTSPRFRGSGLKTAFGALVLAWLNRLNGPEKALVTAANELGSDTDTIATMAGAIIGAADPMLPEWPIQDREYIEKEARRIAAIRVGEAQDSFAYPDLARWQPPSGQSDSVVASPEGFVLVGLGSVEPLGEEYRSGDAVWQWMRLPFGQTVLAKRRAAPAQARVNQLPVQRRAATPSLENQKKPTPQPELTFPNPPENASDTLRQHKASETDRRSLTLDQITDQVINSDFDPATVGRAFNHVIERHGSIEDAIAFAAIIAKARIARLRRRSR